MKSPAIYLPFFVLSAAIFLSLAASASAEKPELPDISEEQFRKHLIRKKAPPRTQPVGPPVPLRSEPRRLSKDDVRIMLARFNFYDSDWHKSGDFKNDFVDNRDGTVTDRVTGLMWQQSGSDEYMPFREAQKYIDGLNRQGFARHRDWRLPTIEELASLIERVKVNGLYIDPIFDRKQRWCWSADSRSSGSAWYVHFSGGGVNWDSLLSENYVRAVRSWQ